MVRIGLRTSRLARWSRRLAGLSLLLVVLPIWMHRTRMLDSTAFQIVFSLALLLAIIAVLTGVAAYFRIWQTGDGGWGRATLGIIVGLACLSPVFYGAAMATRYPLTNDVTTNLKMPLNMVVRAPKAETSPGAQIDEQVRTAFPGVQTRFYETPPEKTFDLIARLVALRQWDVRVSRPLDNNGRAQINALAMTFMGWRDEVAIRVMRTLEGAQVDMRSASLNGVSDLGVNGKRIETFLAELDRMASRQAAQNNNDS